MLEIVLDIQLREQVVVFNLLSEYQSGFRPLTALLNITDDFLRATDPKQATALLMLDLSKAFDILNHWLSFTILKYIGTSGNILNFIRNYFTIRSQRDRIGIDDCCALELISGVPQGSILRPPLFTLYTSDIYKQNKNCKIIFCADDTQLDLIFP